jgi:hypothetical protein
MMIPKAALDQGKDFTRVTRVKARMASGEPPIMMSYDPLTDTPLFAEEDQEAFEAGYICINCYQYQRVPNAPKCNWNNRPDHGCGHQNF